MVAVTGPSSGTNFAAIAIYVAIAAIFGGVVLCWRGLIAYRRMTSIQAIGTSKISTAAAGEVRLSGRVTPAGPLLTAPRSGEPCVYFKIVIVEHRAGERGSRVTTQTQSAPFVLDDGSATVTVFSRDAVWDVPEDFQHSPPPDIDTNSLTPDQLEVARARLLTVRQPDTFDPMPIPEGAKVTETRVDAGDLVTVIGSLLPFGELEELFEENTSADDPVIAEELAEARAEGGLAASPEEAWGNAAIPGFGIGEPVRPPVLDPEANPMPVADPEPPAGDRRSREEQARLPDLTDGIRVEPETLVVAAGKGHPLAIFAGTPAEAVVRADAQVAIGVLGAALAILGALATAWLLTSPTI